MFYNENQIQEFIENVFTSKPVNIYSEGIEER